MNLKDKEKEKEKEKKKKSLVTTGKKHYSINHTHHYQKKS